MTTTPNSVVVIAPQVRWDQLREFWQSQGYELGEGVEMSATGNDPATHRGAHAWLTEDEAQKFTFRENPSQYANGYTFGQATACMNQYRARNNGNNINHGMASDASRTGRLSINFDDGVRLTKRAFFDQLADANSLEIIVDDEPGQSSLQRSRTI